MESQDEALLLELFNIFSEIHIQSEKKLSDNFRLELNYLAMSLDIESENAAQDWIEKLYKLNNESYKLPPKRTPSIT